MPRLSLILTLTTLLISLPAHAKDLRKRVGVGFNTQIGASSTNASVAALSARVGLPTTNPAVNVLVEADLGFGTYAKSADRFFAGGRLLYSVVAEDNLNLYLAAGAGMLNSDGDTLVRVQPGVAVDFFLFGLENLGFTTGWGVDIDMGTNSGVATTASAVVGAHYWF